MSPAKDAGEFGPLFDSDGTQEAKPDRSFSDPLAGLVSSSPDFGDQDRFEPIQVAAPVQPDVDAVRAMVDSTLAEETGRLSAIATETPGEAAEDTAVPLQGPAPLPEHPAGTAPGEPLGMLPQQRTWPARQVLRPGQRAGRIAKFKPSVALKAPKPSAGSAGVILAVVLLIVFGVLAIQMVSSLIDSITGLFD
ncbi:hypothetical protein [Amycolatopsis minnesotensis]|uniref:Uncharacterized protein n=1 Tax=Amycolatopsis minnesotensis TaxID=337894 RepID=A0ABP5BGR6_9PSEU